MMNKDTIYLDYAAATPLDTRALEAMMPYFNGKFYNPSALYLAAREVNAGLADARKLVAQTLGSKSREVVFTSGGTEGNNLAIRGVMAKYPDSHMVTTSIEHASVFQTAKDFSSTVIGVDKYAVVDLEELESSIGEDTVLVTVMYANNELGTIQPIKEIAAIVARKRLSRSSDLPLYLHIDACQAANYLDLDVNRLGVDLMSLGGGKIYGPKQSGVLYVRRGVELISQITGGGQDSGLRSGTESPALLHGFATMLQVVQSDRKEESQRLQGLKSSFIANLSQKVPKIMFNGHPKKQLPNYVHITVPGVDAERLLMELDEVGIQLAIGSACSASDESPSHVLLAVGMSDQQARSSLRMTFGRQTTESEIGRAVNVISSAISSHLQMV